MNNLTLAEPKEAMVQRLNRLRAYADRVVIHGDSLAPDEAANHADEAANHAASMQQFLDAGESYGLTPKEMVDLVLGELFLKKRDCGCHSCRSREQG